MASTVPVAGSAYTYAYATMGEFVAWVIGWDLILEYAFGATTVAIGWSGYLTSLLRDLGLVIPAKFMSAPLAYDPAVGTWSPTDALVNLPAMFIIVLITILLVVGSPARCIAVYRRISRSISRAPPRFGRARGAGLRVATQASPIGSAWVGAVSRDRS
jgi:hypothetical protein